MGLRQQYQALEACWAAAEQLDDLRRQGADTATLAQAQAELDEAQAHAPRWSRWPW